MAEPLKIEIKVTPLRLVGETRIPPSRAGKLVAIDGAARKR
jgi:hypothetical protein